MFGEQKKTYGDSVVSLVGHLFGTCFLFIALLTVVWLASVGVKWLNDIHPFPEDILSSIQSIETVFFWFDTILCFTLLIIGAISFIRDINDARG